MRDAYWIWPAVFLTIAVAAVALSIYPHPTSLLASLRIWPAWMAGTIGFLMLPVLVKTLRLMAAGEDSPTKKILEWVDWTLVRRILIAMGIAGLNKIVFIWLKPGLNVHVPFTADPLLASIDNALFLGNDPWIFLQWANNGASEFIYHPVWYALMICALILAASAPPSPKKTAIMLTYFLCWSVVGPVIHCLLPAGGPIFYEALGYGDRFAANLGTEEANYTRDYLWRGFSDGQFLAASGISAMPSLHVTIATWTVLCVHQFRPKWTPYVAVMCGYIVILSVSLGWHYVVDGIVGGSVAALLFYGLRSALDFTGKPVSTGVELDPRRHVFNAVQALPQEKDGHQA